MNRQHLLALAPRLGARADAFVEALNNAMARFAINTPARQAAFLGQVVHESAGLTRMTEDLNYSPGTLMACFNNKKVTRFTPEMAALYARTVHHPANQQMIANVAYANRMGNGSIESGDGWRYRGRGPGQLTGKDNYTACGEALGLDLVTCPDQVAEPTVGCLAFAWFWDNGNRTGKSLNLLADIGKIDRVSLAVNGGSHGLAERIALTQRALEVLA
ncbi:glycoside hydrolase family 19 protein [Massilia sp. GCM10020059]|uniref:Glycoside hydrolase family 19 protein n=1 Tax=Massilia agrisoli TaxID=2892444 RepID=A0ABS8IUA6_9BURK|nr:glycoside hydrolase family 19 protein [Massilia agrisoli]MCC6071471.1 glycoside hydrolase family 19 protein [Massilia agrisoli]